MAWLDCLNANAPAVQAVGTLLAVAIAIYVPFKIHQNETQKQNLEALRKGQALAILVEPLLHDLRMQVEAGSMALIPEPRRIEVHEALLALAKELWLMGKAGGHVSQVIGLVQIHNRILWELPTLPIDMLDEEKAVYVRLFNERISLMREDLDDATREIGLLLEPEK